MAQRLILGLLGVNIGLTGMRPALSFDTSILPYTLILNHTPSIPKYVYHRFVMRRRTASSTTDP